MSGLLGRLSELLSSKLNLSNAPSMNSSRESSVASATSSRRSMSSKDDEVVFNCRGTLYQLSDESRYVPVVAAGGVEIAILRDVREHIYFLLINSITGNKDELLRQNLQDGMAVEFAESTTSVQWACVVENKIVKFAFRFLSSDALTAMRKFIELYDAIIYETLTGEKLEDQSHEDYDYLTAPFSGRAPMDVDEASTEPQEDEDVFLCAPRPSVARPSGVQNQFLSDAVKYNSAIVIGANGGNSVVNFYRYNEHGEFQHSDTELKFDMKNQKGDAVNARGALLLQDDRNMFVLESKNRSRLLELDLEAGKVVTEYEPGLEYQVEALCPSDKLQEANPNLITCLARSAVFTIDRRAANPLASGCVESGKALSDYAHKLGRTESFTCHATSAAGHLAVGDMCGQIRLFSGPPGAPKSTGKGHFPKTAKTLLPALPGVKGTPVIALDITSDGSFVLATFEKHLLVIQTTYNEDDGATVCAFEKRMGGEGKKKPPPMRLDVNPQQAELMGGREAIKFTKATFDESGAEHWIVAACGPFVVTWNFDSIRKGIGARRIVTPELSNHEGAQVLSVMMKGSADTVKYITSSDVGIEQRSHERKSGKTRITWGA